MLSSWLDILAVPAAVLDTSGNVLGCNQQLCATVSASRAHLTGRPLASIYPDKAHRRTLQFILDSAPEATSASPRLDEFFLPQPDGRVLPVIVSAAKVPTQGVAGDLQLPAGAILVTFTDVTSLKEAEAGLREHFEYVSQLSDTALEQAIALKRRFQAAEKEAEQLRTQETALRSQTEQLQDHAIELQAVNRELERRVAQRTAELRQANLDAIYMLAVASEAKDQDTGDHVRRIRILAERTTRALGLSEADAYDIGLAAILHDVGKIHVPDAILSKPGPLTAEERAVMQQHTLWGQRILPDRPFFVRARAIARGHHENHDGSGYPDGNSGDAIPIEARIVHVVDVYDALVSPRAYKAAWPREKVLAELAAKSGTMFDPAVVAAFLQHVASAQEDVVADADCKEALVPGTSLNGTPK